MNSNTELMARGLRQRGMPSRAYQLARRPAMRVTSWCSWLIFIFVTFEFRLALLLVEEDMDGLNKGQKKPTKSLISGYQQD